MLTHVAACCHMLPPWKDLFKYSWSERSTPSGVISGVHFPTAEHRNRVRVCRVEETVPEMFRTIQNVWCLYALGSTLFQCNGCMLVFDRQLGQNMAKLAISTPIRRVVSGSSLHDAQADITYSTCCDMRCTQQRARQSICSGRELSILSTDCTKPSPTMNIMNVIINWTINYIILFQEFLNVHDLVEELTPLPSLQTQSTEAKPRWAKPMSPTWGAALDVPRAMLQWFQYPILRVSQSLVWFQQECKKCSSKNVVWF